METELKSNLIACASAYAAARSVSMSTIGRLAAGDWRFFDRLDDDGKTFTARKYDEVISWFSERWPDDVEWPVSVARPAPSAEEVRA
jgi:predicted DNA-binding protein with PD1-like motif